MNVSKISPRAPYVVSSREVIENKSSSGIVTKENTDDFIVFADIVATSDDKKFPLGTTIVYHVTDSYPVRDGAKSYDMVNVGNVLGTYAK